MAARPRFLSGTRPNCISAGKSFGSALGLMCALFYGAHGERAPLQGTSVDRHSFITSSSAFASSVAIGGRFGRATGSYPFSLGVASGQPRLWR
jgi:hypothetical protein